MQLWRCVVANIMSGIKFTYIVAVMTCTTVILQVMLLYTNHCYFSRNAKTTDTLSLGVDLEEFRRSDNATAKIQREQTAGPERSSLSYTTLRPVVKRRLTIGIPTIKRRDGDYFKEMLDSMFNKTSEEELRHIVFVVFLADLNDTVWKSETEAEIRRKYNKHIHSGSLIVAQAPKEFYDGMRQLRNNSYINWRTKQNYDYAFLMKYCQHFSDFYIQMEDDVLASDGYYSAIFNFVAEQPNDDWICLEFSELGFIGKLYHSKHLRDLGEMLLIFSHTQPVDYTYVYFNNLLGNGLRRIRKPTLFQHIGYHSSLAEKIQPLRDKYFDFPPKEWKGDNPSAKIFTTLKTNDDFSPHLPYSSDPGHFWSYSAAAENDTYTLVFDSSQLIDKVVVMTGSKEHPGDIIHNGVLEASAVVSGTAEKQSCEDFIVLGKFAEGKILVDSQMIKSKLGVVRTKCLQIRLTKPQIEWVIIKEIAVFLSRA